MLEIEIIETNIIEGGVEVFARAWKDSVQIGFGIDGTIDIERFRIINPPVLVKDETKSNIVRFEIVDEGERTEREVTVYLREDPEEALLQALEGTIGDMKNIHTAENIILGKRGNTTTTIYSEAGNTEPWDGYVRRAEGVSEVFGTIRSGSGTGSSAVGTTMNAPRLGSSTTQDEFDALYRVGFGFDTSSIPDGDTVSNITLSIHDRIASDSSTVPLGDTNVEVVSFTPNSEASVAFADYEASNWGTTLFATGNAMSAIGDTDAYAAWTLNSSGIAYLNKTGNTYIGLRTTWDIENSFGGTWASLVDTLWSCIAADTTGTTTDPKLVIEHSEDTGTDYPLTAAAGTFTLTGIAATLNLGLKMAAALGTFTLTGIAALFSIGKGYLLATEVGVFILTGVATTFSKVISMAAAAGTFTLTGFAAALAKTKLLSAEVGTFLLTGVPAFFKLKPWGRTARNMGDWIRGSKNNDE